MKTNAALLLGSLAAWATAQNNPNHPNIVFILTDDQDVRLNSLDYMKSVQNLLINEGAIYKRHYCTVALCCPSRVNLLTGRAAHNTNVTDLGGDFGGYGQFTREGWNNNWLPLWMQNGGYNTYYVGKLMNSFTEKNYDNPPVRGFNGSDFLIGARTYNYFNPKFQRNIGNNHMKPNGYTNKYTTTLTFNKGMAFLDDARAAGGPFFLTMATVAPHSGGGPSPNATKPQPGPKPEDKYANLFPKATIPVTKNFNPAVRSGGSWVHNIANPLTDDQIETIQENYRNRLRALQSVDDLVQGTVEYLDNHGLLENTYIIYSTDNGFHMGQHRLKPGKRCPYEEDINIPLIIRGPGIKAGSVVNVATTHTDLSPTILRMANVDGPGDLDGAAVPLIADSTNPQTFEHAQVEHWGTSGGDGDDYPNVPGASNNTYKALRIVGDDYGFQYTVWCDGSHELYDMMADTYQMNNLYNGISYKPNEPQGPNNRFPVNRLSSRLDALLLVLKGCKGDTCKRPWTALHPGGAVTSLPDAMATKFDQFYEEKQRRVSFDKCTKGYLPQFEGPQNFYTYQAMKARSEYP